MNTLTIPETAYAIGDLPATVRAALVPDLIRFSSDAATRGEYGYSLDAANANLALNLVDGAERALGRFWFTGPNDVHPIVRGFHAAVTNGTFTLTAPTPTADKGRAEAGNALAIMRRREAMALADRAAAEERVAAAEREVQDLRTRLAAQDSTRGIAWGPSHPDWDRFWVQAARDAERAGNCGEYDRHATEMGAPTRYDLRARGIDLEAPVREYRHCVAVTVPVTVHVDVYSSDESNADSSDIREALLNYDGDIAEALESAVRAIPSYRLNYSIEETEDETDEGAYADGWTNPGRA